MASTNWEGDNGEGTRPGRQGGDDYCVEEETLESLQAKLAEYQKSLQDVEAALEISPEEPVREERTEP